MSETFERLERKVEARQFSIDISWRGESARGEPATPEATQSPTDENQRRWESLEADLSAADACKFNDGYLPLTSHRKFLGPIIIFLKKAVRKLIKIFFGWYLFPIYARQSQFNGKLINAVAMEREILYSLNCQMAESENRVLRLQQQLDSVQRTMEQYRVELATSSEENARILAGQQENIAKQIAVSRELQRETGDLQERLTALSKESGMISGRLDKMLNLPTDDVGFYHEFEEKFRGSRTEIRDRLRMYIPYIKERLPHWESGRFIDIGSGRGEWLDILKENGATDYVGVDLSERQNEIAESYGHRVVCEDCVQFLTEQPDESVDLITGFQIIEHLYISDLMELLRQSYRVLKKGGMILFETPNPKNLIVGADTFYLDPSHMRPMDPRMVEFFVQWCGFKDIQCIDANAHPRWSGLSLEGRDEKDIEDIKKINDVFWVIYGPMDYSVFAVKE